MDKIWDSVYRACVEYGQEVADPPHDISRRLDAIVDAYSNAIAAQHETEIAKMEHRYQQANQMDRDIADMARLDMEKAQAQVAVIYHRLATIKKEAEQDWYDDTTGYHEMAKAYMLRARVEICGQLLDALSAAPKVLAMKDIELVDGILLVAEYRGMPGDWVRLVVLECLPKDEQGQESEHGYKRAKGIIPWKEGDELPEDTIARIRGRARE